MGWMIEALGFDFRQGLEIFSSLPRPDRPTQPPIEWVLMGSFPGGKVGWEWSWPLISI